jgi:carbon-monoxide dehydrogenase large subunit
MIGRSIARKEDLRLVTGRGCYVEDVHIPGMQHVAFLRSPHPHAKIKSLRRDRARAIRGVLAVIAAGDYPELAAPLPALHEPGTLHNPYCDKNVVPPQPLFPSTVKHVGQFFAAVVAKTPYAAADALESIEVEYEPLPVIADWEAAMRHDSPRVHEENENVLAHIKYALGDFDEVLAEADLVIEQRLAMKSLKSMALECRGSAANWDETRRVLNVWSTSQQYYLVRDSIAQLLKLSYEDIEIVARDVGGGFGLKGTLHPEDIVVPILAYKLKCPLRWVETRSEHMVASHHSGDQVHDVCVVAKSDGTILGIDVKIYKDVGAFNHFEMVCPTNTVNHLPTHYRIPNIRAEAWAVSTNKAPVTPYRGAGRLEAAFTMDRVLDLVARRAGLDPLEVRRRNIIPAAAMPYRTGLIYRDGVPVQYDGGDYPAMLEKAIERVDYYGWRKRQQELSAPSRSIGIGISSYVEGGGIGPCEGSTVRVDDNGKVVVLVGVNSQGQSHETTFAQVCAHHLGARIEDVEVVGGNTHALSVGFGTAASRVLVNTGNAVFRSAETVKQKIRSLAGTLLECDAADIEVKDSKAYIGGTEIGLTFAELAAAAQRHKSMAAHGGPGLIATEFFYPRTVTWSAGVHIAVIELDRETGDVTILKYVMAHDSGKPINPAVVEGQLVGGAAQGLGAGLFEGIVYDGDGQLLTGSMMDYAVIRADEMPVIELEHFEFPTKENPLGVRGVGESGPISPPAVLASAIEDAIGGDAIVTHTPVNLAYRLQLLEHERTRQQRAGGLTGRHSASGTEV